MPIDISVNPHLNTGASAPCNPSASSTQTTVIGNWQDVYVYGYYQTVLQANLPFSELATSDIALIYEPYVFEARETQQDLSSSVLFLEISLHRANTIFMQRHLDVWAAPIAFKEPKSNTRCSYRLVSSVQSCRIKTPLQTVAPCCTADSFRPCRLHLDPRLH